MAKIVWSQTILDAFLELPEGDQRLILEKVDRLQEFPEMYPVRVKGRFRGYRWFFAGNRLVYYRVTGQRVYIRALWPARLP